MKKLTGSILFVGSTVECPDIRYASRFCAPDPVVLLVAGQQRHLVVSDLEFGRAQKEAIGVQVYRPDMLGATPAGRKTLSGWAVALMRKQGIKQVYVPADFKVAIAEKIRHAGIKPVICKTAIFPERAVKRPDEIANIKQSQQAAVLAMRAAVSVISQAQISANKNLQYKGEWLTSETVRKVIYHAMVEHGCMASDIIVAGGTQSADPHMKGQGTLRAHEPIVIDIFPQHMEHGYWGDLTRTVCRGEAPAQLKKMYSAVKSAHGKALQAVKAGVQCATVHRAAAMEIERRGFVTGRNKTLPEGFIHGTGHGVGLSIHEAPRVGLNKDKLKSGNIITIEPGLYYHDIGGIRLEDTIEVTRTGWKFLVPCEKKLEI